MFWKSQLGAFFCYLFYWISYYNLYFLSVLTIIIVFLVAEIKWNWRLISFVLVFSFASSTFRVIRFWKQWVSCYIYLLELQWLYRTCYLLNYLFEWNWTHKGSHSLNLHHLTSHPNWVLGNDFISDWKS